MEGLFRRRNLPHWDVLGHPVFITGCLHGSLSHAGMSQIDVYRNQLECKQRPDTFSVDAWEHRKHKLLFAFIDKLLDHHSQVKHFENDRLAEIVVKAFLHFAGIRYSLLAFVVMPSHHHWLFLIDESWAEKDHAARMAQGKRKQTPREVISHSIQSYTSNECNKVLGKNGRFWQQESYDHWARDEEETHRIIRYIEDNPVSAGLTDKPEHYRWSSAHFRSLGILPGTIKTPILPGTIKTPRQDA